MKKSEVINKVNNLIEENPNNYKYQNKISFIEIIKIIICDLILFLFLSFLAYMYLS